ncbi:MAG: hypothetical protein SFU86_07405 [Pirellulaceae bacterium]|nr:hypothetical protein [Pirellulaceae bacterium]
MTWTPPKAAALYGVTVQALENWIRDRLVPIIEQPGERTRRLDVRGLMAIGIIAALRRKGASLASIEPLAEFLRKTTVADILAAFARGETILIAAGEQLQARLIRPQTAVGNDCGFTIILAAIDLQHCYRTIALRMQPAPQPSGAAANG